MRSLSTDAALRLLFASRHATLETSNGDVIPVHAADIGPAGALVTAPRLRVSGGMTLVGRVLAEDGSPWEVRLRVADAEYASRDLAKVTLEVASVGPDSSRRRTPRMPVGGVAWLIAVNCQNVVDGDRVDGTMVDLSLSGVAFTTGRTLRRADRLELHGRFFADVIEAAVVVQSVRAAATPGRIIAGCAFAEPDAELEARVRRILAPRADGANVDLGPLRESLGVPAATPVWRRVFRRPG
jgi:PilZ domain